MYKQEKDRMVHLTILICYTIFIVLLAGESILMGWDMGAILLLFLGAAAGWILHITAHIANDIRLWLYFILCMMAFFFYGIHETSMYDLAPVMMFGMLLFSLSEKDSIINGCLFTYYLTMIYDFLLVRDGRLNFSTLAVTRLLLHFVLVYVAGYMIKLTLKRRNTEQRMSDEKILELEEINHRTEQFLTNVSHELRTPINAVTGITTVMMKNEENPQKKKDIFAIQSAGRRLFQQIEDILDYTEIDTGRIKISEEYYMLSSVVNDIIAEERQHEKDHDLEVVFDVDASVPSMLVGDGRKIKKIIKHLLDNGIKFTKQGGVYVRVSAMPRSYGINLCINIRDTGIGVSGEQLDKIREKFYQSKNGRMSRAGGLGLGLSIVYGMVAAMNGFIQIDSKEGEGTGIFISIPQKVEDETPCMSVANRTELCIACYLNPEKYKIPEVRDYFNLAISHLVQGLDLSLHRVVNKEELDKLISLFRLTHLFVGQEEYEEDEAYYEELGTHVKVVVVAKNDYSLSRESKLQLVRKPFYSLSIVNILNADEVEKEDTYLEKHILCPGVRVLVVDDEPMNLMVAEGIFKEYQMDVTTAESGMEAVALCKKESFDLVFLDHMMPEMDGVETLKLLRKISSTPGKALTVIAFTANAVSGAREMFRQEGFDEFVSKPVEDIELERVLKKVLPRSAIVYENKTESDKNAFAQQGNTYRFEELKAAGIQVSAGLNYCRNDEEFYIELLEKFAQEAEKKSAEITQFLEKGDCENYRIRVHALKSTSKMVGANHFSEMAKEAEEAAKNHNLDYIRMHQEELLTAYWHVVDTIKEVLGIGQDTHSEEALVEITRDELLQRFKELGASLDTFEIDKAENLIAQLSEAAYEGNRVCEWISEIKQDVENFECTEASLKLEKLITQVEGEQR